MKNNNRSKEVKNVSEFSKPLDADTQKSIPSDIDGSYTGHPLDGGKPVQDADDL